MPPERYWAPHERTECAAHGVDALLPAGDAVLKVRQFVAELVGALVGLVERLGGLLGLLEETVDLGPGAGRAVLRRGARGDGGEPGGGGRHGGHG